VREGDHSKVEVIDNMVQIDHLVSIMTNHSVKGQVKIIEEKGKGSEVVGEVVVEVAAEVGCGAVEVEEVGIEAALHIVEACQQVNSHLKTEMLCLRNLDRITSFKTYDQSQIGIMGLLESLLVIIEFLMLHQQSPWKISKQKERQRSNIHID